MPELDENYRTPAGSPRKQAASAPPMLDVRFARSDSLSSAASHPSLDPRKHSACRSSGELRPIKSPSYTLQLPHLTAPRSLLKCLNSMRLQLACSAYLLQCKCSTHGSTARHMR